MRNFADVPAVEQAVPAGAPFVRPVEAVQPRGPIANSIEQHAGSGAVHAEMVDVGRASDATMDARVNAPEAT